MLRKKKEMSGQKEINRKNGFFSLNKHTEIFLVLKRAFKANVLPQKFQLLTRFQTSTFLAFRPSLTVEIRVCSTPRFTFLYS